MLLFYCARRSELPSIESGGLPRRRGRQYRLWTTLAQARKECGFGVVVVEPAADGSWLSGALRSGHIDVDHVERRWILNLSPYRSTKSVTAAGGIVTRWRDDGCQVLTIFRRGQWDLPKGKRDGGEPIRACAEREVCEEIGISDISTVQSLGTTTHAYDQKGRYMVKTTHWFEMRTNEVGFTPERAEGIERVTWMPISAAIGEIGYSTLRSLLRTRRDLLCRDLVAAAG